MSLSIPEHHYKYFSTRKEAEEYVERYLKSGYKCAVKMKRHNMWEAKILLDKD